MKMGGTPPAFCVVPSESFPVGMFKGPEQIQIIPPLVSPSPSLEKALLILHSVLRGEERCATIIYQEFVCLRVRFHARCYTRANSCKLPSNLQGRDACPLMWMGKPRLREPHLPSLLVAKVMSPAHSCNYSSLPGTRP
jgi:hypothetical protein